MTLFPLKENLTNHYQLKRIPYEVQEFDPDPDEWDQDDRPKQEDGEGEMEFFEREEAWSRGIRRVVQPNPGEFEPPPPINVSIFISFHIAC